MSAETAGPDATYVRPLTSLRGGAALLVAVFHVYPFVWPELGRAVPMIARGYLWVDLFFVLSGFVLARAHAGDFLSLSWSGARRFWQKRVARIYPMHAAVLAALLGLHGVIALGGAARWPWLGRVFPGPPNFGELTRTLLLVHGWGFSTEGAWNLPSWSISVEWALYLVFPLAMFSLLRRPPTAALRLGAMALGLLAAVAATHRHLDIVFDGAGLLRAVPEFCLGLALHRLGEDPRGARAYARLGEDTPFALALLAPPVLMALPVHDVFVVLSFVPVVAGASTAAGRVGRVFGANPFHWLGLVSYSVYMLHAPVFQVARALGVGLGAPLETRVAWFAVVLVLTLALAAVTYPLVEVRARRALAPRA